MKLFVEKIPDLHMLYIRELRLLLSAEEMIAIKMQALIDMATDSDLHKTLREHLEETEVHAARLREILKRAGGETSPLKCRVVYALFDEAEDMMQDCAHLTVRNVALIAAVQRIEHYEIAAYGALRQFAWVMGLDDDAQLLDQSAREEERSDRQLTQVAERVDPSALKAA